MSKGFVRFKKSRVAQEIQLDPVYVIGMHHFLNHLKLVLTRLRVRKVKPCGKCRVDRFTEQQLRVRFFELAVLIAGIPSPGTIMAVIHPKRSEEVDANLPRSIRHGLDIIPAIVQHAL